MSTEEKAIAEDANNVASADVAAEATANMQGQGSVPDTSSETAPTSASKKPKKGTARKGIIAIAIVAVVAAGGAGMYVWHEQPSFCSTLCHIEQTYVDNYSQEKNTVGTDKYGNEVSNTNAMMAVLHSHNDTTAKPEIVCVDCHEPNMTELASDGVHFVTGDYYTVRTERTLDAMKSWDNEEGTQFCVNESCHAYLMGEDGLVDRDKLEHVTATMDFNPHDQYHEATSEMSCGTCHKGHRASVYSCTACHEDIELPDGWVTAEEGQQILEEGYTS